MFKNTIKRKFVLVLAVFVTSWWVLSFYYFLISDKTNIQLNVKHKDVTQVHTEPKGLQPKPVKWKTNKKFGELGEPVVLPSNLTSDIQDKINDGYKKYSFNQYVSDLISVQRNLPDPRHEWCTLPYQYDIKLPKTSVIIPFYNEAWSVLLRSVYSILNRSPPHLIEEIILVDDFSDMYHLKQPLEDYWAKEPKVKILRNKQREGLIRTRLFGTNHAKGEILTFLDSHIEVATGWLEPLLDKIKIDYKTVVCPIIDVIDFNTFEYRYSSQIFVGGFDWTLTFSWHDIPERDNKGRYSGAEPVRSPTMAGGLFSISKKFFEELGTYDEGFEIWGGENLELSFKIWMCGGTLEIIPCSRVGHIFRETFPYKLNSNSKDVLGSNLFRLAEVWLDDYKKYYYERRGNISIPVSDVSNRLKLRSTMGCKTFKWYLENIYPDLFVPDNIYGYGLIQAGNLCLNNRAKMMNLYEQVKVKECFPKSWGFTQFWYYSGDNEIRKEELCVEFNNTVYLNVCNTQVGTQQWDYELKTNRFIHRKSGNCLQANPATKNLEVEQCVSDDTYQKWTIEVLNNKRDLEKNQK